MRILNVFQTIRHLLELIRFSHTLFALPFALLAAVMAWHATAIDARWNNLVADYQQDIASAGSILESNVPGEALMTMAPIAPRETIVVFRWQQLLGMLLCMVAARSFAMSVNRLADRRLDAENPRTAGRHFRRAFSASAR